MPKAWTTFNDGAFSDDYARQFYQPKKQELATWKSENGNPIQVLTLYVCYTHSRPKLDAFFWTDI